jgi:hypothetical protein
VPCCGREVQRRPAALRVMDVDGLPAHDVLAHLAGVVALCPAVCNWISLMGSYFA